MKTIEEFHQEPLFEADCALGADFLAAVAPNTGIVIKVQVMPQQFNGMGRACQSAFAASLTGPGILNGF